MAAFVALLVLAAAAEAARPNVVTIVTDDQTLESFNEATMPETLRLLATRGTSFSQAVVSTPQCCPSRAGYLTGQYAQNNKVISNRPGYPLLKRKRDILPEWLRSAGYRTIHVGKYLNGYAQTRGAIVAPGWDRWLSLILAHYRFPLWSIDGELRQDEKLYLTSTINQMSEEMIRTYAPRKKPFYLQVDQFAPHVQLPGNSNGRCRLSAIPPEEDADLFVDATVPRNPAFDEADVSDKPSFIQDQGRFSDAQIADIDRHYGCALASLRLVDEGISSIVSELKAAGELGNTMIIFTSDNGYGFGEHRMSLTKGLPYEEHVRVPLVIRPPRQFPRASRRGRVSDAPVANIDLAPTLLRLVGGEPCRNGKRCRRMDGRSLISILDGRKPRWSKRRAVRTSFSVNFNAYKRSCEWDALRTTRRSLIEHTSLPKPGTIDCEPVSVFENYDLNADPFQLDGDRPVADRARERLRRLTRCSGIEGRDRKLKKKPFCE